MPRFSATPWSAVFDIAMRIFLSLTLLVLAGIGSAFAPADADAAETRRPDHVRAIELARSGEFAESIELLARLRAESPEDPELLYDQTVVFAWAGDNEQAVSNAGFIDPQQAPDYVVDAGAKAFRNLGRYEEAVNWYTQLLERDPANLDARLGLSMSLADSGTYEKAHQVLEATPANLKDDSRITLAEAYVLEHEGKDVDALAKYQHVLELDDGNRVAQRNKALLLRKLMLPRQALSLAEQNPEILTKDEKLQLEADVAAADIRQGINAVSTADRKYDSIDRALGRIDTLMARGDIGPDLRLRLKYDRIVALTDRRMTADAVTEFEALDRSFEDIPTYVLSSAGTAYLDEHQPAKARAVLEHAVNREPDNHGLKFRLFFAYTDLQQYDKAKALTDSLLATLEKTHRAPNSNVVKGSDDYLRAQVLSGLVLAYADQLAESQEYFETVLADLPHNTDIRQELANVYRWRGWLDRSRDEYAQVLAVEPDFVGARVGDAHTRLDAGDFDVVESEIDRLEAAYGDEPAVQNLGRRWRAHNRSKLDISARTGESSGATFGEREYRVDSTWSSKPIANRYRVLLQTHDAFAQFPEGDARRRRAAIGFEYHYGRWRSAATLSAARSGGELGLGGTLNYRLNDLWDFEGRLEKNSNDTPLRGYRVGVTGNLASVGARYARNESTAFDASLAFLDLSDGNTVASMLLAGEQRLLNYPRLKVTLVGDVYSANRRRDDVPYYSPKSDFSWSMGLRGEHSIYRRYRMAVSQSLTTQLGHYDQAGFPSGSIWVADYRVSLTVGERWYTDLAVRRQRSFYDGVPEFSTFFIANFSGRF